MAQLAEKVQQQITAEETRAHDTEELLALREKVGALEKENEIQKSDFLRLQEEAQEKQTNYDALLRHKDKERDTLKAENTTLRDDLKQAEENASRLTEEKMHVESQRDEHARVLNATRKTVATTQKQRDNLQHTLDDAETKIKSLEATVTSQTARIDKLMAEVQSSKVDKMSLSRDNLAQRREVKNALAKYTEVQSQNEKLYEENIELRQHADGSGGGTSNKAQTASRSTATVESPSRSSGRLLPRKRPRTVLQQD